MGIRRRDSLKKQNIIIRGKPQYQYPAQSSIKKDSHVIMKSNNSSLDSMTNIEIKNS